MKYTLISVDQLPGLSVGGPGGSIKHYTFKLTFRVRRLWGLYNPLVVKFAFAHHDQLKLEEYWSLRIGETYIYWQSFIDGDVVYVE
ncbi:hypothetical protein SAMN04488128_103225 [Chitinophaga eiseniae]|uniref:Uncharacterized protein n=1 Tax=Chitinophaga eiseniae TaxID=634771 RepID=A0A1T4SP99_9BACT|nr:hypothetical protein [Chitinophaga eiseniae]SKA30114.1 hypothetical protein SAMN04488128_103225 [Chitinophaga eiseniae]